MFPLSSNQTARIILVLCQRSRQCERSSDSVPCKRCEGKNRACGSYLPRDDPKPAQRKIVLRDPTEIEAFEQFRKQATGISGLGVTASIEGEIYSLIIEGIAEIGERSTVMSPHGLEEFVMEVMWPGEDRFGWDISGIWENEFSRA